MHSFFINMKLTILNLRYIYNLKYIHIYWIGWLLLSVFKIGCGVLLTIFKNKKSGGLLNLSSSLFLGHNFLNILSVLSLYLFILVPKIWRVLQERGNCKFKHFLVINAMLTQHLISTPIILSLIPDQPFLQPCHKLNMPLF